VFFGRSTAFLRAVVPTAAGAAHMSPLRFLFWNVVGGVTWGVGFTLLGFFAGEGYEAALRWAGRGSVGVLVLVALIAGALAFKSFLVRRWASRAQKLPG
jgi:membrane protein DedA with SNARE-associated domain